jgi:hypothetical protein
MAFDPLQGFGGFVALFGNPRIKNAFSLGILCCHHF